MTMNLLFAALASTCLAACDQSALNYKQLHAGFNGPHQVGTFAFTSKELAQTSWIKPALADRFEQVLSQVDFSHQVLVAATVGERITATGKLDIRRVDLHDTVLAAYVLIGGNENGCNIPTASSFPFVLAVIEKPKKPVFVQGGFDDQNFPDGCKPVLSGEAHDGK